VAPAETPDFVMDAKTDIKRRPPNRHMTEGSGHASDRSDLRVTGRTTAWMCQSSVSVASRRNKAALGEFGPFDMAEIFKKTPYIADLKPEGRYIAKHLFQAGGVPLLMKTLLDHGYLRGDCLTVAGRTIAETLKGAKLNPHRGVMRPADRSITTAGGVVGLKGSFAPEGAIVKVAGMLSNLKLTGPARRLDRAEDALEAVRERVGRPGTRDGDIDAVAGRHNAKLSDARLANRKTRWMPHATYQTSGALRKYARQIGTAVAGAVSHPGGAQETYCYANI
jgi:dihydroxyacid dehydratase/phosphogluconate dehydratase